MKKRTKKNTKQKSFFFEDYAESQIVPDVTKNSKLAKVSINRASFLFIIFFSLILIFSIKIIYLSLFNQENYFPKKNNKYFINERRDIVDRNGIILARNIDIYSAGIRPKLVKDKKKMLLDLRLIFPKIDTITITKKLNNDKFFYIKKRLTEDEKTRLWLLGNKAIEFEKKQFRIYPQKNLLSH